MAIGSFFVGSLPFGYWAGKSKGVDIRTQGSGNVGATNVYRVLGRKLGFLVFVLDIAKGYVPAAVAGLLFQSKEVALLIGAVAIAGHCLSPFLGFKGGKGIATGLGAILGASPLVALGAFVIFVVCLAIGRYVSVASLVSSAAIPPIAYFVGDPAPLLVAYVAMTAFVWVRHRSNIGRLLAGTEPKFGSKPDAVGKQSGHLCPHTVGILVVIGTSLAWLIPWLLHR